jgi:Asp-tRNA(Asn)/Glu-tRNA(Gln) amidotransferase C subunit
VASYEAERRPVDEWNCQRSLEDALNHFAIIDALGVAPGDTAAHNMEQLRRMRKGRPEDVEQRSSLLRAMRAQSMEFSQLNVEYGYTYESAALVPDSTPSPEPIDSIRICQPSTRPGTPLPHRVASPSPERLRRAREVPFDSHATAGGVTLGVILLVIGVLGVIAAIIVYRRVPAIVLGVVSVVVAGLFVYQLRLAVHALNRLPSSRFRFET